MGFFSRGASGPAQPPAPPYARCPICEFVFVDYSSNLEHAKTHITGEPGRYHWECSCGNKDCCWEYDGQAAFALLSHISDRHNMMLDFGYGKQRMPYPS